MEELESLFSAKDIASLQQDSHTPLYHQMYMLLKSRICNGTLSCGTQLPTEYQLADTFKVSRITAKRALDDLAAEGLVERRRGKGTHVTYSYQSPKSVRPFIIEDLCDLETIAQSTDVTVLDACFRQPPAQIKETFGIEANTALLNITRIRSKNKVPFAHYTSWTKGLSDIPDLQQLGSRPRIDILRTLGIKFSRIEQTLSAISAPIAVAKELSTEPGSALLSLTRLSYGKSGQLIDRLDALYNPDHLHCKINIPSEVIDKINNAKRGIAEPV